jgi:hypothetical protein
MVYASKMPVALMFSGGRDSTLAAVRLHEHGHPLTLVTVTSDHLVGIERVERRLRELRSILPDDTEWVHVRQGKPDPSSMNFNHRTCLPCHREYVSIAGAVLAARPSRAIAFGYVSYQQQWPEQTPIAIESLSRVLGRYKIELVLPVHSLTSKEAAVAELERYQLSPNSWEQKCLRQVDNIKLDPQQLKEQVGLWEAAIDSALANANRSTLDVIREASLMDL